jgi:hypothetical protein
MSRDFGAYRLIVGQATPSGEIRQGRGGLQNSQPKLSELSELFHRGATTKQFLRRRSRFPLPRKMSETAIR